MTSANTPFCEITSPTSGVCAHSVEAKRTCGRTKMSSSTCTGAVTMVMGLLPMTFGPTLSDRKPFDGSLVKSGLPPPRNARSTGWPGSAKSTGPLPEVDSGWNVGFISTRAWPAARLRTVGNCRRRFARLTSMLKGKPVLLIGSGGETANASISDTVGSMMTRVG